MPAWARKQTRSDAGPGPGSNTTSSSAAPAARRRATSIQSTTGTAVGGRPSAVARGESMSRRAGGAAGSGAAGPGAGGGAAAAAGGAAGKQGGGMKKTEYMGPDGDLVANLERDVLDRSPGIRCVLCACSWLAATCAEHVFGGGPAGPLQEATSPVRSGKNPMRVCVSLQVDRHCGVEGGQACAGGGDGAAHDHARVLHRHPAAGQGGCCCCCCWLTCKLHCSGRQHSRTTCHLLLLLLGRMRVEAGGPMHRRCGRRVSRSWWCVCLFCCLLLCRPAAGCDAVWAPWHWQDDAGQGGGDRVRLHLLQRVVSNTGQQVQVGVGVASRLEGCAHRLQQQEPDTARVLAP